MQGIIEQVTECHRRNFMTRGLGRRALSVADARRMLRSRPGRVVDLITAATPVAALHCVTVSIRARHGAGLTIVTPDYVEHPDGQRDTNPDAALRP